VNSKLTFPLLPVVVSAVVSASVAVVATEIIAPAYSSANSGAVIVPDARALSLSSVNKTIGSDFHSTDSQISSLQKLLQTNTTALQSEISGVASNVTTLKGNATTLQANLSALQTSLGGVAANASQTQTEVARDDSTLTTLTPIVTGITQRLYDTCALTSDLWQRSFANGGDAAWVAAAGGLTEAEGVEALERCYSEDAGYNGTLLAGILPSNAKTSDPFAGSAP
jgi:hypothetical protein